MKTGLEKARELICREEVAEAITAEREACAQVALRYEQYNFGPTDLYAEGANAAIRLIAAAIRARKT